MLEEAQDLDLLLADLIGRETSDAPPLPAPTFAPDLERAAALRQLYTWVQDEVFGPAP